MYPIFWKNGVKNVLRCEYFNASKKCKEKRGVGAESFK